MQDPRVYPAGLFLRGESRKPSLSLRDISPKGRDKFGLRKSSPDAFCPIGAYVPERAMKCGGAVQVRS